MYEFMIVYLIGAAGYGALELLFRGWTHWSMLLTGGLCFLIMYLISTRLRTGFPQKVLMCAAAVTSVEYAVGMLVNVHLGWGVWNYSHMPLNLSGQICAVFALLWLLLSIPCVALSPYLRRGLMLLASRHGPFPRRP